jgi:hypothetical protein
MEYAENINGYSPHKETVYKLIENYYDNPKMVKVEDIPDKNSINGGNNGKSIYACKIFSLLSVDNRYIIAITPKDDLPIGFMKYLKDIEWECFQTRSIRDYPHKFKNSHKYSLNVAKKTGDYLAPFHVRSRTKDACEYVSNDLPLLITLLNSGKSIYTFGNEGTLISALETFNTILTFINI